jgi:dihydrofolate synthase/folylpolyglutamate synthase
MENDARCWVVSKDTDLDVRSRLLGPHQRINEAIAVKVAQLLKINKSAIKDGLRKTIWPGRCQIISKDPFIIVDGAHNAAGARALSDTIKELKIARPRTLILGIQAYKDINGILEAMVPLADIIIVTRSSHPQAANLEEIARRIDGKLVILINSVGEAVAVARGFGHPVIVAGSLFVAAEVLKTTDKHLTIRNA